MARASKFSTIERDLQLATAGLAPENIARELAKFARTELANAITADEASPIYEKFINGRQGDEEETVTPPGPILYVFSYWQPIIEFALRYLEKESPVKTGRYKASHRIMIGSQFISPATPISSGEEVSVVNMTPYSRKIEVGHMKMSVPDMIYHRAMAEVKRQFGKVVEVRYRQVLIPGGYTLKGRFRRGYKQFARTKLQKDTQAGSRMTYPALVMRIK